MKKELDILTEQYKELIKTYLDLERLNLYLISHHSTAIEGSTLTILETEIFLDKGLTAKGKPLEHQLCEGYFLRTCVLRLVAAETKL
jgi:hypothetical protein